MKRLKIALTLLFALCCSLSLFACTKSDGRAAQEVEVSGQKETFKENEEFSIGDDIEVTVYYAGIDEPVVFTAADAGKSYTVDSSMYDKTQAGEYTIFITPTEQSKEAVESGELVSVAYTVTVEHAWGEWTGSFDVEGYQVRECTCKAKEYKYPDDMTSQIVAGAWNNVVTVNDGAKPFKRLKHPAAGEFHASLGTLVAGQSLTVTLRLDKVDTGNVWFTPLMGARDGIVGVLPREDAYVIGGGPAGAFNTPDTGSKDTGPQSGAATQDSPNWLVYRNGTSWAASDLLPDGDKFAYDTITYSYQTTGIFMIRHTLQKADGSTMTFTDTFTVPESGYECVAYGESVTYTIVSASYTEGKAVKEFKVTAPDEKVQAEGKLFEKEGMTSTVVFDNGDELTKKSDPYNADNPQQVSGNYFAFAASDVDCTTPLNLASAPLEEGMHHFYGEFSGQKCYLTSNGAEDGESLITVVGTQTKGANATTVVKSDVTFISDDVAFDYTLNKAKDGIQIVGTGSANALNAAQKAVLGNTTANNYVAFLILGSREGAFDSASASGNVYVNVVNGNGSFKNIEVVAPLEAKEFDITLKLGAAALDSKYTIHVNLTDVVEAKVAISATLVGSDFTLDKGGIYTVEYVSESFKTASDADLGKYELALGARQPSIADVQKAAQDDPTNGYKASNSLYIRNAVIDKAAGKITVTYWIAAPEINKITAENAVQGVTICSNGETLAGVNLYYNLVVSEEAVNLAKIGTNGENVYAQSSGNKLVVFMPVVSSNVRNADLHYSATINIQNELAQSYNIGLVTDEKGVTGVADTNLISSNAQVKAVVLGTAENVDDYDHGALLVMVIDLNALGLRVNNKTDGDHRNDKYLFTANEDTETGKSAEGSDDYTIFTVGDGTKDNADKITSAVKSGATKKPLQPGDCFNYDISAAEDDGFRFGAKVTKPTGQHSMTQKEGVYVCSVCGAVRNYDAASGTDAEVKEGETLIELGKKTTPEQGLTATFEVRNATSDWNSWALVTGKGDVRITLPNLDSFFNSFGRTVYADADSGVPDDPDTPDVDESKKLQNGEHSIEVEDASEELVALGTKMQVGGLFPAAENKVNGGDWNTFLKQYAHVTITVSKATGVNYYLNGELKITYPASTVMTTATVADFAELFILAANEYGVYLNLAGAPMLNFTVYPKAVEAGQVVDLYSEYVDTMGEPEAPAYVAVEKQAKNDDLPEETWEADVNIEKASYSVGASWYILKGQLITVTGSLSGIEDNDAKDEENNYIVGNWIGGGMIIDRVLKGGENMPCNGRIDHWNNGEVVGWAYVLSAEAKGGDGEVIEDWVPVMRHLRCAADNVTVFTFDYTQENKIVVSMKITSETLGNSFTMTYTVTPVGNAVNADNINTPYTLDDWLLVGITVDGNGFTGKAVCTKPAQA